MLVTPGANRRNRRQALIAAGLVAWATGLLGWAFPVLWILLGLSPFTYWWVRRRCHRRVAVMRQPFPDRWEQILREQVAFFLALDDAGKARFRQLVQIFLDEVRITGIRTEVDATIRVLVAASAAIPIFGFHDWEYRRLREVLIYPDSFDDAYQSTGGSDEHILGMVGLNHLSGVMILSSRRSLRGSPMNRAIIMWGCMSLPTCSRRKRASMGSRPRYPGGWFGNGSGMWHGNWRAHLTMAITSIPMPTRMNMNSSRCWRNISSRRPNS